MLRIGSSPHECGPAKGMERRMRTCTRQADDGINPPRVSQRSRTSFDHSPNSSRRNHGLGMPQISHFANTCVNWQTLRQQSHCVTSTGTAIEDIREASSGPTAPRSLRQSLQQQSKLATLSGRTTVQDQCQTAHHAQQRIVSGQCQHKL